MSPELSTAIKPLSAQLDELEDEWRAADRAFERAPGLEAMVEQTRCRARWDTWTRWEHAPGPTLRVAAVRERLWTPQEAFDSCRRMDASLCESLVALLPLFSCELVSALVEHTRGESWARNPSAYHVGMWVSGRLGGDRLLWRLSRRLADDGDLDEATEVFGRIQHVGARTEALRALDRHLQREHWLRLRSDTARLARAQDPIRRLYALCELSALYPAPQARGLVREAIDGLPRGHEWVHLPGGLMTMPLSEPVAIALDREGLRDELDALIQSEGKPFSDGLFDFFADREPEDADDDALEALAHAEASGACLPAADVRRRAAHRRTAPRPEMAGGRRRRRPYARPSGARGVEARRPNRRPGARCSRVPIRLRARAADRLVPIHRSEPDLGSRRLPCARS